MTFVKQATLRQAKSKACVSGWQYSWWQMKHWLKRRLSMHHLNVWKIGKVWFQDVFEYMHINEMQNISLNYVSTIRLSLWTVSAYVDVIVLNRSWPAVSHICSFTFSPSTIIVRILKSTPIVVMYVPTHAMTWEDVCEQLIQLSVYSITSASQQQNTSNNPVINWEWLGG